MYPCLSTICSSVGLAKIKCNPIHSVSGALPLPYVQARVTRGFVVQWLLRRSLATPRLAVELLSTETPLCSSQYLYGTMFNDPLFDGGTDGF